MYLAMFRDNVVLVLDINMIPGLVSDRTKFPKRKTLHKAFASIGGYRALGPHNILTDPGSDLWAAKRRIMDPAFNRSFLRSAMLGMNLVTDNLVHKLRNHADSEQICDISEKLDISAMEAISICGFNWTEDLLKEHSEAVMRMVRTMAECMILPFKYPLTYNLPWAHRASKRYFREAVAPIREIMSKHLTEEIGAGVPEGTILSRIVQSNACSDVLGFENLVDEYALFLLAGSETTSIASACVVWHLTRNPDVYKLVTEEVDRVFGEKTEIGFDEMNKLTYLEMVIKESMRLKPAVTSTGRQCKQDSVVGGVVLPKGTGVVIPYGVLHTDPRYWKDPETFDPERFSRENKGNIVPYTYMPFSTGQRSCVGKNFAMLEMKVVLSRVIREFELANPDPEDTSDIELVGNITVRPKNGIKVRISVRGM